MSTTKKKRTRFVIGIMLLFALCLFFMFHIEKLNNRQLSMMFLLPLLPALIISSCFVYVSAGKMQLSAFHLPVFSNNLWIIGSLSIAFVFFILLYGVYYIAARISYRRQ